MRESGLLLTVGTSNPRLVIPLLLLLLLTETAAHSQADLLCFCCLPPIAKRSAALAPAVQQQVALKQACQPCSCSSHTNWMLLKCRHCRSLLY